ERRLEGTGREDYQAPAADGNDPPRTTGNAGLRERGRTSQDNGSKMRLKDQVALVTGGSRGIGRGIVQAFAREGAKVAFVYRGSQSAAEILCQEFTAAGGTIKALQCDVTKADEAQKVVDAVEKEWGPINILVNNAGIIKDGLFVRMEPAEWNAVIDTNLNGTF